MMKKKLYIVAFLLPLLLMLAIAKLIEHEPLPIRKADLRRFRRLEQAASKAENIKNKRK